jgi:hypothetical protein
MANKNTKFARAQGFASMHDLHNAKEGGTKVFKGSSCDTAWNAPGSKRKSATVYKGDRKD